VRHATALLILTFALGGPAWAKDITLAKTSVEEMKGACEKAGGSFSQDATMYGCGTDCHGGPGTACIVNCRPEQKCIAQVSGGGRTPRNIPDALLRSKRR
jgi:hypothetical protein